MSYDIEAPIEAPVEATAPDETVEQKLAAQQAELYQARMNAHIHDVRNAQLSYLDPRAQKRLRWVSLSYDKQHVLMHFNDFSSAVGRINSKLSRKIEDLVQHMMQPIREEEEQRQELRRLQRMAAG